MTGLKIWIRYFGPFGNTVLLICFERTLPCQKLLCFMSLLDFSLHHALCFCCTTKRKLQLLPYFQSSKFAINLLFVSKCDPVGGFLHLLSICLVKHWVLDKHDLLNLTFDLQKVSFSQLSGFFLKQHHSAIYNMLSQFLATLVALHLTPVSEWIGEWVVVSDSD